VSFELSEKELPKVPTQGGLLTLIDAGEFPKKASEDFMLLHWMITNRKKRIVIPLGCFIIFKRQSGNDDEVK
jgi:hypothetical protein